MTNEQQLRAERMELMRRAAQGVVDDVRCGRVVDSRRRRWEERLTRELRPLEGPLSCGALFTDAGAAR